ncbi:hypothetical protein BMETH_2997_0 [methanotrophic bacterial endosymbiont of Bathymodiolus sp.]|nr:hypothetical protein BMETH_2997_0 [methanotrophic bacterial endosymbiont of Bathymodiolus sp.]
MKILYSPLSYTVHTTWYSNLRRHAYVSSLLMLMFRSK